MLRSAFSLCLLTALIAAPIVGRAEAPATPADKAAPSATVLIVDLRGDATAAYGYESWKDSMNRTPEGVSVVSSKGAQGNGGFCGTLDAPMDLSGMAYIEIALGTGTPNEVPEVTVGLADADGTLATARIRIDQLVPKQPVWLRVPLSAFHESTGAYAGKKPGMDWAKVTQWHCQGDWATKKPFQAVFIALRARR
jgi:hypothetical protein